METIGSKLVNTLKEIDNARKLGQYENGVRLALSSLENTAFDEKEVAFINLRLADMFNEMPDDIAMNMGFDSRRARAGCHANVAVDIYAKNEGMQNYHADALVAWGVALWFQKDRGPANAIPSFSKALGLFQSESENYAVKYVNAQQCIGLCEHTLGNLTKAAKHFQDALECALEAHLDIPVRDIKRQLANIYGDEGRLELAAGLLDEITAQTTDDFVDQIRWLNARVLIAEENGEFHLAHDLYDKIHTLFSAQKNPEAELGAALTNAASFKLSNGNLAQAKAIMDRAASIDKNEAPMSFKIGFAKARALFAANEGQSAAAAAHLKSLRSIIQKQLDGNEEQYFETLILESLFLQSADEKTHWVDDFFKLVDLDSSAQKNDFLLGPRLRALSVAGEFMLEQQDVDWDKIKKLLRIGFRACCSRKSNESIWQFYSLFCEVLALKGKIFAATLLGKLAISAIHEMSEPVPLRSPQREALLKNRRKPFERTRGLLNKAGRYNEAQNIAYLFRWDAILNVGPARRHVATENMAVKFSDLEENLAVRLSVIREKLISNFNRKADVNYEQDLGELLEASDQFFDLLLHLDDQEKGTVSKSKKDDVQISDDTGYLTFLQIDKGYRAELVSVEGTISWEILGRNDEIAVLLKSLFDPPLSNDWRVSSKVLSDIVLEPAFAALAKVNNLEIQTEGLFSQLPFCCLFAGEKMLVETHALAFSSLFSKSGATHRRSPTDGKVLVAGLTERVDSYPFLEAVGEELLSVEARFSDTILLDGRHFTIDGLKRALKEKPSVVHLATHFQLHPGSPAKSFFVLATGEKLFFSQLSADDFDWNQIDLLFLSACETASADWGNHGLETVPDLFRHLNVNQVIGTLWPVLDHSTSILANKFYDQFARNPDVKTCLAEAQRSLLESREFSEPAKWAGFKCFV